MVLTPVHASTRPMSEPFPRAGRRARLQDHSSALTLRLSLAGETGKSTSPTGVTGAVTGTGSISLGTTRAALPEEVALELHLSCGGQC